MNLSATQIRWFRLRRSGLGQPFDSPETAATQIAYFFPRQEIYSR